MEHIWTILMLKILQAHLLPAFVANSKIDAIYALYLESFCDKNLAIRKVFAFCDSAPESPISNRWYFVVISRDQQNLEQSIMQDPCNVITTESH